MKKKPDPFQEKIDAEILSIDGMIWDELKAFATGKGDFKRARKVCREADKKLGELEASLRAMKKQTRERKA